MKNIMEQLAAGLKNGPLAILTTVSYVSFDRLAPYILAGLAAYPVLCSFLRFRKMRWLHRKYNFPNRESLACMTDDEAWEIQRVLLQQEFPFFFIKALQFALFRVRHSPILDLVHVLRARQSTKRLNRRTASPLYPVS
jgi:hypothetical protein